MANLAYGESVFGGVGTGLYTMLLYVLLAVFIGGLMVGRTPEYLGKKIEAREIKLVVLGLLFTPLTVLVATAWRRRPSTARRRSSPRGPQGFSESLYAYLSQANNNGSAFAGYTGYFQPDARQPRRARHHVRRPARRPDDAVRALHADRLHARRRRRAGRASASRPPASGTMRTDTPTFGGLLIGTVVLIGALTFFPALLLGPVVQGLTDHLF